MKKYQILIIIMISLIIAYFGIYYLQYKRINNFMVDYWFPPKDKIINEYKLVICEKDLKNPKVAFVIDQVLLDEYPELTIYFSKMNNTLTGKVSEKYLGATTIRNTTFHELVKMVKEDCSQFQQHKGDFHDETLSWTYSKAQSEDEIYQEDVDSIKDEAIMIRNFIKAINEFEDDIYRSRLNDVVKEHGDYKKFTDEELVEWAHAIDLENKIDIQEEEESDLDFAKSALTTLRDMGETEDEVRRGLSDYFREEGYTEDEIKEMMKELGIKYILPEA